MGKIAKKPSVGYTEKNPATNFVKRISERGENNIYSGLNSGEKNLVTAFPTVALEWDYSRNAKGPAEFPPYSNKRVFWICNAGHQWEEKINNRTRNGLPCPYCGGSRPIPGVNDLGTLYPRLEKQWDYERNGDLKPSNVFHKSNRRVSWICEKGHKWEAKIYHRTEGRGCPFCAGIRPILGETDLETLEPVISKQWHPEKTASTYHLTLQGSLTTKQYGSVTKDMSTRHQFIGVPEVVDAPFVKERSWCRVKMICGLERRG